MSVRDVKPPLCVRTQHGLGDCFLARPFVAALACEYELTIETSFPQAFMDLAARHGIRFVARRSRFRTQLANELLWDSWQDPRPRPAFRLHYERAEIQKGRTYHESLEACVAPWIRRSVLPVDILMRVPDEWLARADSLLSTWSKINGPPVLVRPPTIRREWPNPARNCDPGALQLLVDELRPDHTIVGVAWLAEGEERLAAPLERLHVEYFRGELGVETLIALSARTRMIGPVGWLLPMAIATGGDAFILFGGNLGDNDPGWFLHPGYPTHRLGFVLPDAPCLGCTDRQHECSTAISPDRLLSEFRTWQARTR